MSQPLVSIVVPSYNHGRHLGAAIESVLQQSYPDVELIVIDDGSTDDSLTVLESFRGRIHWESQPNAGQAAALNKGWALARGEILSYLSADDRLLPNAVSTAVEELQRHPDSAMVYPDFNLIDERSHLIRRVHAPDYDYFEMVVNTTCAPGPGVFLRRWAYERAGGWNPDFRQWPDYEYWLRLGLQGPFVHVPEVLAEFRVHAQSQTFGRVAFQRAEEPVQAVETYYRTCRGIPVRIAQAKRRALSNAHLVSAQLHFRAGRVQAGLCRIAGAARLDWKSILSRRAVYLCLHGLLARPLMALWLRLRGRPVDA